MLKVDLVLIDLLGWDLSGNPYALNETMTALLRILVPFGTLIVVSNEVGMGVVPAYPMGRAYRDLLGKANQVLARRADKVYVLIAGLAMSIKGD